MELKTYLLQGFATEIFRAKNNFFAKTWDSINFEMRADVLQIFSFPLTGI